MECPANGILESLVVSISSGLCFERLSGHVSTSDSGFIRLTDGPPHPIARTKPSVPTDLTSPRPDLCDKYQLRRPMIECKKSLGTKFLERQVCQLVLHSPHPNHANACK